MSNFFKKAVKHEAKLRLAIAGPAGAGKTYSALEIASHLIPNPRIAVVDTEHGSASKYSDLFDFFVLELDPPFHPDRYVEALENAAGNFDVVILDSLSHAWNGAGGLLELVEQFSKRYRGNSYAAWGDATPIQTRLVEGILQAPFHVIFTMRSKQEYILIERNGKQVPQKVGMAPVQRDGIEFEADVYLDMDTDNNAIVSKTRCSALTGRVIAKPGKELAETLAAWLSGEPAPENPLVTELNGLGGKIYGDGWDDKRPELCLSVSKERTNRSDHLYDTELQKLIDGMKKRANGNGQQPTPESTGPAEQEPLFDETPAAFSEAYRTGYGVEQ